jgi:ceramide glucosyltransferase
MTTALRHEVALALIALAGVGIALLAVQLASLRRHLAREPVAPTTAPGLSILKPLCGLDDELELNLESFARLSWPRYEVLLGLRSTDDPAYRVARHVQARHPGRFRIVLQRGEPGLNPKVNQLVTLAGAARYGIVVVSDSNVRVEPGYLAEIAALLEDEAVGLVTHLVGGVGERRLGSLLDHLHLAGSIAPAVVCAKRVLGRDLVVGKSMAFRRSDLERLGGFESVKDVLAEDYVLGVRVSRVLGKRVAVASRPVLDVSVSRGLGHFVSRYSRWAVLQRSMAGRPAHLAQAVLNPVLLAGAACAADPRPATAAWLVGIAALRSGLDGACARALRGFGHAGWELALAPLKDLLLGAAWARALVRSDVVWRGRRIRVLSGTRIVDGAEQELPAPLPAAR